MVPGVESRNIMNTEKVDGKAKGAHIESGPALPEGGRRVRWNESVLESPSELVSLPVSESCGIDNAMSRSAQVRSHDHLAERLHALLQLGLRAIGSAL